MKRLRHTTEALEMYAAQLRQCLSRALERAQSSKRLKTIDRLAIYYAMYYLECSAFHPTSPIAQARRVVTESVQRVLRPHLFADVGLEALLDQIVLEATSEDVADAVAELASLRTAREMLTAAAERDGAQVDDDGDDDDSDSVAIGGMLAVGASALFWERCERFILAVSLQTVSFPRYALLPHHDKELQNLLEATDPSSLPELVGDLLALSSCPAEVSGIDAAYYTVCYSRANFLLAKHKLKEFAVECRCTAPVLSAELLLRQREAAELAEQRRLQLGDAGQLGTALDFQPDDAYLARVLEQENDTLGNDEDFNKDEIADYYLRNTNSNPPGGTGSSNQSANTAELGAPAVTSVRVGGGSRFHHPGSRSHIAVNEHSEETNHASGLIKPHRYCKVKTGYVWSQYNRTHYDSRNNPPPKQVLWYEFVLFYPALAKTRRNLDNIFRVENTEIGAEDDFCIIVFAPGPPYADVAYRIVRRQWDRRPGGVRASFNDQGRFRLFFRFTGTSYRR